MNNPKVVRELLLSREQLPVEREAKAIEFVFDCLSGQYDDLQCMASEKPVGQIIITQLVCDTNGFQTSSHLVPSKKIPNVVAAVAAAFPEQAIETLKTISAVYASTSKRLRQNDWAVICGLVKVLTDLPPQMKVNVDGHSYHQKLAEFFVGAMQKRWFVDSTIADPQLALLSESIQGFINWVCHHKIGFDRSKIIDQLVKAIYNLVGKTGNFFPVILPVDRPLECVLVRQFLFKVLNTYKAEDQARMLFNYHVFLDQQA